MTTEPKKQEPSILKQKNAESAAKRLFAGLNRQELTTEIAIQAMQGLLAGGSDRTPKGIAGISFEIADAMIEAIEARKGGA